MTVENAALNANAKARRAARLAPAPDAVKPARKHTAATPPPTPVEAPSADLQEN